MQLTKTAGSIDFSHDFVKGTVTNLTIQHADNVRIGYDGALTIFVPFRGYDVQRAGIGRSALDIIEHFIKRDFCVGHLM